MPSLQITGHDKTKSGNDVAIAGKDRYMVGKKTSLPPIGARIKADTSESQFQGSKGPVTLWWLNDWSLEGDQPPATEVRQIQAAAVQATGEREAFQRHEAMLRFVSNVVGSAIGSGGIKDPMDLAAWVDAAHKAAQGIMSGRAAPEFSDKIPF